MRKNARKMSAVLVVVRMRGKGKSVSGLVHSRVAVDGETAEHT